LSGNKGPVGYRRARSRILIQITLLIGVVVILSGLGTFFLLRNSQQHIVDNFIDNMMQTEAKNISSSYDYLVQLLLPKYTEKFKDMNAEEFLASISQGKITEVQKIIDSDIQNMLNAGFFGLDGFMLIFPPSAFMSKSLVWASNDESLVYNWEVPDYLASALEDGRPYIWKEDGIPELGLEGEYLVTLGQLESPFTRGLYITYVGFKPMNEEINAITGFFFQERKSANLLLGIVLAGLIAAILLIIFFFLNYLIRKRITGPIDELSTAAEEIMQGDMDVEIQVRKGEEFAGLKIAFKQMVDSVRRYIARSVGEQDSLKDSGEKEVMAAGPARTRSRILFQITLVLVVVMVIYGLAAFLILRNSEEHLIDKGTDRMVQTEAENFLSSLNYAINISVPAYVEAFKTTNVQELLSALSQGRITDIQMLVDADMRKEIEAGFHGLQVAMLILPPSGFNADAIVWASSDEGLIYNWQVPDYFAAAMEEGTPYLLKKDGIPELGLSGEYLITFNQVQNPFLTTMPFYYVAIKPMSEELRAINDFCDRERRRANIYLGGILVGSIIIVILITFFFLNYLINKQIVRPVKELSAAAAKVLEGDLDVAVDVQEGEELEDLKRAFNEMLESLRNMITKSVG
jgi:methyl-accepting chemotaxis protein